MLNLLFNKKGGSSLKILFLGAHSDDIEIGCGGTILRMLEEYNIKEVYWEVFSGEDQRDKESKESANLFLEKIKRKKIDIYSFRNAFFPFVGAEIKECFEALKAMFSPDVIFTHYRHDLHQDHRLISDLTWNTFRDHLILEYEIVKFDGDLGNPNFFVHLSDKICKKKIRNIQKCFKTQEDKHWFSDDTFLSILRLRGIESNAPQKYAEAFYCRKMVM
jgi:LmbE family N-acetylglucosaminyl deacetylase